MESRLLEMRKCKKKVLKTFHLLHMLFSCFVFFLRTYKLGFKIEQKQRTHATGFLKYRCIKPMQLPTIFTAIMV